MYRIEEYRDVKTFSDLPEDTVRGIGICVHSAFEGKVTEEDALNHMSGDQILVANMLDGAIAVGAFSSTLIAPPAVIFPKDADRLTGETGAYFAGATVHREIQSQGMYKALLDRRADFALDGGVDFIYTRTQSGRVIEGMMALMDRLVAAERIQSVDYDQLTIEGAYGEMLTPEPKDGRHIKLDYLDREKGDAIVATWSFERIQ